MYMSVSDVLATVDGGINVANKGIAFPIQITQKVYELVAQKRWIILGGDILTPHYNYTYDNWYYQPNKNLPLEDNVQKSIFQSNLYISKYIATHGSNFLVIFVISNSYIEGR